MPQLHTTLRQSPHKATNSCNYSQVYEHSAAARQQHLEKYDELNNTYGDHANRLHYYTKARNRTTTTQETTRVSSCVRYTEH